MGRRTVTVDVDVDVDVDINDFDTGDLIDELEDRGYVVLDVNEEKARETNSDRILWLIRQSYITDTPENFRKFLELKFLDMDMPA
jgi:ACT domain-containing protein